ncbi:MAG: NAD(P)/FAD-dependent oxidoreductase [Kiloniellales bacterium]
MRRSWDVAIAGGGVIGSAVAYFLTAEPGFDGSVLVVERDPSYASAATGRSWGGIRQQFSTPENVAMSLYGARFVKQAAERLKVDGAGPELNFREHGYLFLASPAGLTVLEANCALQRSLGGKVALMDLPALADRFPWLNLDGLAGGGFGLENEGWFDPMSLLDGFRRKARALGADYVTDEVVGVRRDGHRVQGVRLRSGAEIACGVLVDAAGPDAARVARMAGCELPVRPRKRMTYVFDCRQDLSAAPLTIDVSGVAFRPEGRSYIAIVSPPADQDPDSDDLEPEYELFDRVIWPTLAARVPAFEAIKLARAWAGHYDYNTFDQNAILGPHPEIEGLLFANGFSGHGVQQSPAAGRAIAELIAFGGYRSLDLGRFGYGRIVEGRPLKEANVV